MLLPLNNSNVAVETTIGQKSTNFDVLASFGNLWKTEVLHLYRIQISFPSY
jgi:hypothetical protein